MSEDTKLNALRALKEKYIGKIKNRLFKNKEEDEEEEKEGYEKEEKKEGKIKIEINIGA